MNSRKVLHVIDELGMGGAQTLLLNYIPLFRERYGSQHELICLFEKGPFGQKFEDIGVPVTYLELEEFVRERKILSFYRNLKSEVNGRGADVVEAHLTWSRIFALFAFWRKGHRRLFAFEHGDIYYRSLPWKVLNFLAQFWANKVLVCSSALARWNQRNNGLLPAKTFVLDNGVNEKLFDPNITYDETRADFGLRETDFVLCGVGTLGRGVNKRFDVLIDAMSLVSDSRAHLVICGDGEQRQELEQKTKEMQLEDKVTFLGMVKNIPAVMKNSDIFVHAAPFEPFGLVAVEAMMMELPAIVPNSGGVANLVGDGRHGFLYESLNAGELAEKIDLMAKDPQRRSEMGVEARQHSIKNFSLLAYIKKLGRLYGWERA
jgi:glycosyltransferase involved in cell wall biosynthesis